MNNSSAYGDNVGDTDNSTDLVDWSSDDDFVGPTIEGSTLLLKAYHWYFFAINVIFILPTIFGNSLIIISLIRFPHLRRLRANILVGNLALSDLLVGLVAMPMDIAFLVTDKFSNSIPFCTAHMSSIYALIGLSVVNLFLLSYERFDAIGHPLKHEQRFTRRRMYIAIGSTWFVMLGVFGTVPFLTMHTIEEDTFHCRMKQVFPWVYRKVFLTIVLLCLGLSSIFFLYVFFVATKASRTYVHCSMHQKRVRKDLRHTMSMLIITGLFIVFWAPFCFVSMIPEPSETTLLVRNWLSSLGVVNSCINWIVYGVRCKKFRAAFWSILTCDCTRRDYKLPSSSKS